MDEDTLKEARALDGNTLNALKEEKDRLIKNAKTPKNPDLDEAIKQFDEEMGRILLAIKTLCYGAPRQKTVIALEFTMGSRIIFWASEALAKEFKKYGSVHKAQYENRWELFVDPRFDFEEVVEYINNLEDLFDVS